MHFLIADYKNRCNKQRKKRADESDVFELFFIGRWCLQHDLLELLIKIRERVKAALIADFRDGGI